MCVGVPGVLQTSLIVCVHPYHGSPLNKSIYISFIQILPLSTVSFSIQYEKLYMCLVLTSTGLVRESAEQFTAETES